MSKPISHPTKINELPIDGEFYMLLTNGTYYTSGYDRNDYDVSHDKINLMVSNDLEDIKTAIKNLEKYSSYKVVYCSPLKTTVEVVINFS
jgi:hypothetical protein